MTSFTDLLFGLLAAAQLARCISPVLDAIDADADEAPIPDGFPLAAVDCSQPKLLKEVSMNSLCQGVERGELISFETPHFKDFSLMTETRVLVTQAFMCSMQVQQIVFRCGVWQHTKLADVPYAPAPVPVAVADCQTWAENKEVVWKSHRMPFRLGQELRWKFHEVGASGFDASGESICLGQTAPYGGAAVRDLVVIDHYYLTIELSELHFEIGRDGVGYEPATGHQLGPHCRYTHGACRTGDTHTFVWEAKPTCRFELIKHFKAASVQLKGTNHVYLKGHGEDKVFVQMGERFDLPTDCPGMHAYHTNYEGLVVAPRQRHDDKLRNVQPVNMDMTLEASIRDDWFYAMLRHDVAVARTTQAVHYCSQERTLLQNSRAQARQLSDGMQPVLDNNTFVSFLGEVVAVVECANTVVYSRDIDANIDHACYWEMPVQQGKQNRWLTPNTRMLKNNGTKVVCNKRFRPKFQDNNGVWIEVDNGTVRQTRRPPGKATLFNLFNDTEEALSDEEGVVGPGGIYTEEEIEEWDHYLEFPVKMQEYAHDAVVTAHSQDGMADANAPWHDPKGWHRGGWQHTAISWLNSLWWFAYITLIWDWFWWCCKTTSHWWALVLWRAMYKVTKSVILWALPQHIQEAVTCRSCRRAIHEAEEEHEHAAEQHELQNM